LGIDHLFKSIAKARCKNHHKAHLSIIANKDENMLALEKDFSERYLPTKDCQNVDFSVNKLRGLCCP
jgi:hypothetical protein